MHTLLILLFAGSAVFASEPGLPYSPGLDVRSMNREVSPCQDFYQYACGGWIKRNPIPPDQAAYDVYTKVALDNETFIRTLLEEAARSASPRSPAQQKIGDFYQSCMNEAAVEKAGLQPLSERLRAIEEIKTTADLSAVLLHEHASGMDFLFQVTGDPDLANSQNQIAFAGPGGLGLPDRDYYTKTDAKSVEIRKRFVEHMANTYVLLGDDKDKAVRQALDVMKLETTLAKSMLKSEDARDPQKLFHRMTIAKMRGLLSVVDWPAYLNELNLADDSVVNVTEPKYFKELNQQLKKTPLAVWRSLLRFHLTHEMSQYLSAKYDDANWEFYSKYLFGVKEKRPRWRRCTRWTDEILGEALGQVFVAKTFTPDTKARTVKMTTAIQDAMAAEIKSLPWMGEKTKLQALEKLRTMVNKIGYPEKWRDYAGLEIVRDDFFANVGRGNAFEVKRLRAKIGKPVDRTEWAMTPPTVNAYYSPQTNDINFPAGILQPPLFDPKMDDAPNYGDTGGTIGHELTHAFDDMGRKFDSKGNLRDWWTKKDAKEFEKRAKCVSDQYSSYIAVGDLHVNGKLTNGEDIADLGGAQLAYIAWKRVTENMKLEPKDGLTPEQRFFVGFAQWACGDMRPELKRDMAITNTHSPLEYRVNGVVGNMPEFAHAFSCKKGDPMVRENICRIW